MTSEIDQEREVLESIARGIPLLEILTQIAQAVERQSPDMSCSVLLLDPDGRCVRHAAAPSMPPEFCCAIDGMAIGPRAGSCGTAAFRGERVVVEDIATSELWDGYRHLTEPFGFRACWSNPIFSPEREVLGTFAIYYRDLRPPTEGEVRWIEDATHLAAIAILLDRSAAALRFSEARYRQIIDTAYEGVWVFDAEGQTLFVNQRTRDLLGYADDEILGRGLLEFTEPAERERVERTLRRPKESAGEQFELCFRRKDGVAFWAMVAASPLRNQQDEVVGTLRMITDITQLKRTEAALRQSETEFRALFEQAAIGMALVDVEGHPVRSNRALQRALGYTAKELRRMAFAEFTHPDDVKDDVALAQSLLAGERDSYQIEKRFIRKDGEITWGRVTASLIRREDGAPVFGIGMVEDVTDRKKMEEAVRASDRLRSLVYNGTSDALFYVGIEGRGDYRYLSVNPAFLQATGLAEAQVVGRLLPEVLSPDTLQIALAKFGQAVREKRTVQWEQTVIFPAGLRHGEVAITPLCDDDGAVTNLVGTVHDVTQRKQNEERILAQAKLLDRAKDAILVHDIDGVISYWNRGAEKLYGWASREAVGRNVTELIHRDTTARERAHQRLIEAGEWNGELVQWTRAGKRVIIEASWTLINEPGAPRAVLSINTDITTRKSLELQVHRAQRMESLGTLAGGVAHDFNNILAAILANVTCATYALPPDHPTREYLAEIEKASQRATDLVRQILTFTRHQEPRRQPVKLAPLVTETLKLLRSTLPPKVELRTEFAADLPEVLAEPTQVHQVIMNLGTNAAHAMAAGTGLLSVRAERVVLQKTLLAGAVQLPAGTYARLVIEDTGTGMDEATLERIFDPFFTTKEPGKGTGLGLSVVHGIMKSYAGGISVRSTPGKGTVFTLYFPALDATAAETAPRVPPPVAQTADAGGERILCVDDEAAIVQVTTRLLERRGYQVVGYSDARRALELFESDPRQFDAVVTDVVMPELSGFDLARRLLSIRPGLPIVVTSGHIGPDEFATLTDIGVQEFVHKPTVIDELHAALRRALAAARRPAARPAEQTIFSSGSQS
jgi:PAS domain S-box-containing protein